MENIYIGLCILFGVSSISMAVLFLFFKGKSDTMFQGDIVYDHIKEELPKKVVKRKKSTTSVKRKYIKSKKKGDEQSPMA